MARKMPVYAVRPGEAEAGHMLNAGLTVITDSFPDSGASALSGLRDRIRFVAPVSTARPGSIRWLRAITLRNSAHRHAPAVGLSVPSAPGGFQPAGCAEYNRQS